MDLRPIKARAVPECRSREVIGVASGRVGAGTPGVKGGQRGAFLVPFFYPVHLFREVFGGEMRITLCHGGGFMTQEPRD